MPRKRPSGRLGDLPLSIFPPPRDFPTYSQFPPEEKIAFLEAVVGGLRLRLEKKRGSKDALIGKAFPHLPDLWADARRELSVAESQGLIVLYLRDLKQKRSGELNLLQLLRDYHTLRKEAPYAEDAEGAEDALAKSLAMSHSLLRKKLAEAGKYWNSLVSQTKV